MDMAASIQGSMSTGTVAECCLEDGGEGRKSMDTIKHDLKRS